MTRVHEELSRQVTIDRDENGVVHVGATRLVDLHFGFGWAHAYDRGMQMLLMRILGKGRASELLESSEEMLRVDTFFRRMNWTAGAGGHRRALSTEAFECAEAYADGVNSCLQEHVPWELKLLGYQPESWTLEDSVLLSRMVGYLTLAQSQGEVERFFVELVQAGCDRKRLAELFPGILDKYDEGLIKKVRLGEKIVPAALAWKSAVPRMSASNNWVVAGTKTASKAPMMASDPHLEINRLPAVWYEIVLKLPHRWSMGATMPGLPAVLIGRNTDVSWGATYTFMDSIDSWIEQCREGKYRRGESQWKPFKKRVETIARKGKAPVDVVFWENEHGSLDGDPEREGYYLATRWSGAGGGARSLESVIGLWHATTVAEAALLLGKLEPSFNWVLADRSGHIGYQMSGLSPKRREGWRGFIPVPGWDPANDWQGFEAPEDLPRCFDPPEGFFVTANDDLNSYGRAKPLNVVQGPYRAERLRKLLSERTDMRPDDFCRMQLDVYSVQAERFMEIMRPLLPDTEAGKILAEWDLRYTTDSRGAYLFETFYRELRRLVFGGRGLGETIVDFLSGETGIFADFFINFDQVLLSSRSVWFEAEERDHLYRRALEATLAAPDKTWGEVQQLTQTHLLFGGKLPKFAGYDRGPIALPGGRATVSQGQIYRSGGRLTSFAPSIRMVTDLSEDSCLTCLAGGPSERRFSPWYCSEMEMYLEGRFKVVRAAAMT
jgi:penicillin amidase